MSNAEKDFDYSKPHACLQCGCQFIGKNLLCKTCRNRQKQHASRDYYQCGNRKLYRIVDGGYAVFMSGKNDMRNFVLGMILSMLAVLIFIGATCLFG